jgi:hypothetical protein
MVCDEQGTALRQIAASGQVARVVASSAPAGDVDGLPAVRRTWGALTGLPVPVEGVYLLVAALVAAHPDAAGRGDLLTPGDLVRDAVGQPIGCRGLVRP